MVSLCELSLVNTDVEEVCYSYQILSPRWLNYEIKDRTSSGCHIDIRSGMLRDFDFNVDLNYFGFKKGKVVLTAFA